MPMLLQKLEKLLNANLFIIDTLFIYKTLCIYIRVISMKTCDTFLIYVDPEYDFKVTSDFRDRSVYKLSIIDFNAGETLIEKYTEYPDDKQLEEKYKADIRLSEPQTTNFEDSLESKYNYKILLTDISKPQTKIIKNCFRQLKRIALSTRDLRYKMCVLKDQYLCVTELDETIDCFQINGYRSGTAIGVAVIVALEYFYNNLPNISNDVATIKQSLYGLLNKNHVLCLQATEKMIADLTSAIESISVLEKKKSDFDVDILKCEELLTKILEYEADYLKKYEELETNKPSNESVYVHEKQYLQNKIGETQTVKRKIVTSLVKLKADKDTLYFMMDQTEFDNAVMLDGVVENLQALRAI